MPWSAWRHPLGAGSAAPHPSGTYQDTQGMERSRAWKGAGHGESKVPQSSCVMGCYPAGLRIMRESFGLRTVPTSVTFTFIQS